MAEKIKELLREYRDGKISRRDFLRQAVLLTGRLTAANGLISGLSPGSPQAAQVPESDPEILTHNVEYRGQASPVTGYLARPVKAGKYPVLIVMHENAG